MRPIGLCILFSALLFPTTILAFNESEIFDSLEKLTPPTIEVIASGDQGVVLEFQLVDLGNEEVVREGQVFHSVGIPGGGFVGAAGAPEIPTFTRLVAIPARSGVRVTAVAEEEEELSGVRPLPVQRGDGGPFLFDAAAYQRDAYGDAPLAQAGEPAILRDLRIVPLTFQPVRYNPARGLMKVARKIRVEVSFEGENLVNAVERNRQRAIPPSFAEIYESLVVNHEEVLGRAVISPGTYLVICPDDAAVTSRLQPLLNWRERMGHTVRLATTGETGTTRTAIKAWIQNAYNTWPKPPEFIVLVGDATTPYRIETWTEGLSGYNGEGDHPYVQLDGTDVLSDAHIGRLSISSLTELEAIVNKIVGYESTPFLGDPDWYRRATLVGDPGSSGYSTVIVQQNIKTWLRPLGYTQIDTIYASPFVSQMTTSLNRGTTFFSYRGYLGMSGWTNSNTTAMTNGWKMPYVVTITCDTGSFAGGTARTEGFLRANAGASNPKGGIGAVGTATIGTHTRYNNAIHYGIFRGMLKEKIRTMGASLTRGKLEMYLNYFLTEPNQTLIWSYWNNLMGDPAVSVWTGYPDPITVSHPATIAVGANAAGVTVTKDGGLPIRDAQVCFLKSGETHAVGTTNAQGFIELPINAATSGQMLITVTLHNKHPYLASIPVQTQTTYVGYVSSQVDDDNTGTSSGNGNGIVNPGETIELRVQVRNFGTQTASSVTATLTSSDPYVTITDASETFGNIAAGATAWSGDDFDIVISPLCPHGRVIRFGLDVQSGANTWHSLIDLPVVSADLVADTSTLYNVGANGILDPGETGQLTVKLKNMGGAAATGITGVLSSQDSFISIVDGNGTWGTIAAGASGENGSDRFTITAAPQTYEGYLATFRLVTTFNGAARDTTEFAITVGTRATDDPIGPDRYGYWAFDNTDTAYPEAPVYSWVEIDPAYGGSGIEVPLTDFGTYQDASIVVDLPFPFTYYGQQFTKATICSNGWMAMGSTWLFNYRNWTIPAAGGPDGMLSVFWDDLRLVSGGKVYRRYDPANNRFIVQWSRVRNEVNGLQNVEIILYDPAHHPSMTGDGFIVFQYNQVTNNDSGDNFATVGIESPDGTDGLLYTYMNRYPLGAATLAAGRAIRFVPRVNVPSGSIAGIVRNASYGGAPLVGAEVTLLEAGRTYTTGGDGRYGGTAPAGTYTVVASLEGFAPDTLRNIVIQVGVQTEANFNLNDILGPIITTTPHPSTADTLGPYVIPVTIVEQSGLPQKTLYWKIYGDTFNAVQLVNQEGDEYRGSIPGQRYISQVQYYILARDGAGHQTVDPPGAPAELFSFFVAPLTTLFADDMEANLGWTVGAPDDNATSGIWERVDPVGTYNGTTMVQPEDDNTPAPGVRCFVTDGRGGAQGDYDVDGGKTTVTSPILNLTSYGSVVLRYYRWYTNDTGNNPNEDTWVAQASSDAGTTWVTIESTNLSDRSWRMVEINLGDYIEINDRVRIRYVASDYGGGSIVEAAVDDLSIILTGVVDAPESEAVPAIFSLMLSRPNPSYTGTTIGFSLEHPGAARLILFDVQGRVVRKLLEGDRPAGPQAVFWDGRDEGGERAPAGVYFYRLEANGRSEVKKLVRVE